MGTELVCLPRDVCPSCGAPLRSLAWDQLPLLRHGGYGAALRTVLRYCPRCSFSLRPQTAEVRP